MDFEIFRWLQNAMTAMAAMSGGAFTAQTSVWTLAGCGMVWQQSTSGRHRGLPALVPLTWCPQLPLVAVAPFCAFCHWKSRMNFFGMPGIVTQPAAWASFSSVSITNTSSQARRHVVIFQCRVLLLLSFSLNCLFESSRFTSSSRHSGYQVTAQMQMRRHIIFAPQQDQHGDFSAEWPVMTSGRLVRFSFCSAQLASPWGSTLRPMAGNEPVGRNQHSRTCSNHS